MLLRDRVMVWSIFITGIMLVIFAAITMGVINTDLKDRYISLHDGVLEIMTGFQKELGEYKSQAEDNRYLMKGICVELSRR